jgi:hypothetical protein
MSVQIHINGDTAGEAIQEFATLAAAFTGSAPAEASEPKAKQAAKKPAKPGETKPEDTDPESEPVTGDSVEEDFAEENDGSEGIPTVVDLRAIAAEKGKTPEGKKAVKALLDQFGSKSISDVPEDKRLKFKTALEKLK